MAREGKPPFAYGIICVCVSAFRGCRSSSPISHFRDESAVRRDLGRADEICRRHQLKAE